MDINYSKICPQIERDGQADNAAVCVLIYLGCIGTTMAKFLRFVLRDHIYTSSYINIMYVLDSTRQRFDV